MTMGGGAVVGRSHTQSGSVCAVLLEVAFVYSQRMITELDCEQSDLIMKSK